LRRWWEPAPGALVTQLVTQKVQQVAQALGGNNVNIDTRAFGNGILQRMERIMQDQKPYYLVTGSSGFLGRALCHHFGSKDNLVIGFDKDGPPFPPANTQCLFCDLTSDESVQKTFHMMKSEFGSRIKAVFHLAAYYSFSGKDSHLYKDLTVDGTARILRELKDFDVEQFIFSSSMLVYKPNEPGHKLTENSRVEPNWQYPQSKVTTEELIKDKHESLPAVILRIAGVYDDLCQSIPLAHQIERIYEKQLEGHLYSGDLEVRQAFVHLNDLIFAFEACVNNAKKLEPYSVFNIGEPEAMSYQEIQNDVGQLLYGHDWTTIEVPAPIAKAGSYLEEKLPTKEKPFVKPWMIDRAGDNFDLNIDKAKGVLGWEPRHSLRSTLPKIIEGLIVDPAKWYQINKLTPPAGLEHPHAKHSAVAYLASRVWRKYMTQAHRRTVNRRIQGGRIDKG
jgi:UDP-glucose 4-epimerase